MNISRLDLYLISINPEVSKGACNSRNFYIISIIKYKAKFKELTITCIRYTRILVDLNTKIQDGLGVRFVILIPVIYQRAGAGALP